MTNQAVRATFLLAPTKRPIQGGLDHPDCRLMPIGSGTLLIEESERYAVASSRIPTGPDGAEAMRAAVDLICSRHPW